MNNRPDESNGPEPVFRNSPRPKHTSGVARVRANELEVFRELLFPRLKIFQQFLELLVGGNR